MVTTLHRDNRLVVVNLQEEPSKEPGILCSLGMEMTIAKCYQNAILLPCQTS